MAETYSVSDHFVNKDPSVRALYDHQIKSPSVEKAERISAKPFHHKMHISSPEDFDEELKTWLNEAYILSE